MTKNISTECNKTEDLTIKSKQALKMGCNDDKIINKANVSAPNTECNTKDVEVKRGRGRPKKKVSTECSKADMSKVRKLKHLGFCLNCGCSITNGDFVEGEKTKVFCVRCHAEWPISKLLKTIEKNGKSRRISKKAFLNDVTHGFQDSISTYEPSLPTEFKDIKVHDNDE